jgi:hypothetical protein
MLAPTGFEARKAIVGLRSSECARIVAALAFTAVAALTAWFYINGVVVSHSLASSEFRHEIGDAYLVGLKKPTWPFARMHDSEHGPADSNLILLEGGRRLGPAHSVHDVIRNVGRGAYSDWNGYLRFSTSDNSNPQSNARIYSVQEKLFPAASAVLISSVLFVAGIVLSWSALRPVVVPVLKVTGLHWAIRNVLPGMVTSAVMLIVLAGVGELICRVEWPFLETTWPIRFDSRFGFNFVPESTVQWTNHLDYWARNHVNSLGFLDREPPSSPYPPSDVCRIAVVGDSFVEAAQVPIEKKLQVQLDRIGKSSVPGKRLETLAFGFSGTGQANQLPFYDVFAKGFHPNVLVLVFVGNDFANNSSVLEGIRNGWSPMNPPRLFFKRTEDGGITQVPIDANFVSKELHVSDQFRNTHASLHRALLQRSYLYNWAFTRLSLGYPRLAGWLAEQPSTQNIYVERLRDIKRQWPQFDLSDWNYPDDWDMDTMFFAQKLPPVFKDALAYTGHALDEFQTRARRDGFNLIILADKSMYLQGSRPGNNSNHLMRRGAIDRLEQLASAREVPVIDLSSYIQSIGQDPKKASFAHDGHWSPSGHLWAAQALNQYIQHHPGACSRPN